MTTQQNTRTSVDWLKFGFGPSEVQAMKVKMTCAQWEAFVATLIAGGATKTITTIN